MGSLAGKPRCSTRITSGSGTGKGSLDVRPHVGEEPNSAEEATDFINRFYRENFMGIIFDPEEMLVRYEAGDPIAQLVKRPSLPPGMTPWDMFRP